MKIEVIEPDGQVRKSLFGNVLEALRLVVSTER